jgi:hypothetical protein
MPRKRMRKTTELIVSKSHVMLFDDLLKRIAHEFSCRCSEIM